MNCPNRKSELIEIGNTPTLIKLKCTNPECFVGDVIIHGSVGSKKIWKEAIYSEHKELKRRK